MDHNLDNGFHRTADGLRASTKECPKPCVDCADRQHHWLEDFEAENGDLFMVCKHCEAWREFTDYELSN